MITKAIRFLAIAHLAAVSATSHAEILTVDNNPDSVAMFDNITAAYDAASDGDILLITGSPTSYGSLNSYKSLTLIGSGYLLGSSANENDIPGLVKASTRIDARFRTDDAIGDSSGSRATGLVGRIRSDSEVTDLLVERCLLNSASTFEGETVVRGCFSASNSTVSIGDGSLITNSIMFRLSLGSGAAADHCVIENLISFSDRASIGNSIFVTNDATPVTGSISNSMAVGNSILPEGAGNLNNQVFLDVFLNSESDDGKWQLKEGSPAIGAGSGGADMGAFGGPTPYVLSGVPSVPRITRLVVPATATSTSGLQFEVDAEIVDE